MPYKVKSNEKYKLWNDICNMEDFLKEVSFTLNSERSMDFRNVGTEEGILDKGNSVGKYKELRKLPNIYAAWKEVMQTKVRKVVTRSWVFVVSILIMLLLNNSKICSFPY